MCSSHNNLQQPLQSIARYYHSQLSATPPRRLHNVHNHSPSDHFAHYGSSTFRRCHNHQASTGASGCDQRPPLPPGNRQFAPPATPPANNNALSLRTPPFSLHSSPPLRSSHSSLAHCAGAPGACGIRTTTASRRSTCYRYTISVPAAIAHAWVHTPSDRHYAHTPQLISHFHSGTIRRCRAFGRHSGVRRSALHYAGVGRIRAYGPGGVIGPPAYSLLISLISRHISRGHSFIAYSSLSATFDIHCQPFQSMLTLSGVIVIGLRCASSFARSLPPFDHAQRHRSRHRLRQPPIGTSRFGGHSAASVAAAAASPPIAPAAAGVAAARRSSAGGAGRSAASAGVRPQVRRATPAATPPHSPPLNATSRFDRPLIGIRFASLHVRQPLQPSGAYSHIAGRHSPARIAPAAADHAAPTIIIIWQ